MTQRKLFKTFHTKNYCWSFTIFASFHHHKNRALGCLFPDYVVIYQMDHTIQRIAEFVLWTPIHNIIHPVVPWKAVWMFEWTVTHKTKTKIIIMTDEICSLWLTDRKVNLSLIFNLHCSATKHASNLIKLQSIKDLHYLWYFKIPKGLCNWGRIFKYQL